MSTDFNIKPVGAPVAAPIVSHASETAQKAVATELPASQSVTAPEPSVRVTIDSNVANAALMDQVFIDREADYAVRMGSWTGTVHVVRGPQDIWLVVPADAEPYSSISVRGTGPATLCVVRADVGPPVAKP